MKIKLGLLALLLASVTSLLAQDSVAIRYGSRIIQDDLKDNLSVLASDALEGRETGKRGQKMAAAFISAHFEALGLAAPVNGSYYQPLELYTSRPGDAYIKVADQRYKNFEEIAYYGNVNSGEITVTAVYAGKGRPEDYDGLDVTGKGVVVLVEPEENFRKPMDIAIERGAKMVFVFHPDINVFKELSAQFKSFLSGAGLSLKKPAPGSNAGVFFLSPAVTEKIFKTTAEKLKKAADAESAKALKKIKPGTITFQSAMDVQVVKTENVLGYLEGTDKKDELVVITAHYDHIGKRSGSSGDLINNGADDDGSGTVTVMQLAKAFAQAKKDGNGPRRSILFMTVTAEEYGLLGSEYYASHPVFPLKNTVVNLNIDMVGRRDPQHQTSTPYVYVIGSDKLSSVLHEVSERVNKTYTKLDFDYTYNDQNHPDRLYYRSDHWNFAKNNIPVIFYFDGIHEDYHRPSDEVQKIEFDLLAQRARCVFYTAWEIANRDERIVPDKK